MDLKEYQKRTLKLLGEFLAQCRVNGPDAAFEALAEPDWDAIAKDHRLEAVGLL